jgi:predicted RecB family nuclease
MRKVKRLTLLDQGVTDRGDLATAQCIPRIEKLADEARAALGDAPVYRRRGVTRAEVPRGDVEVDVDLENDENGAYLWDTLATGTDDDGYRPFYDWGLLTPETEAGLFLRFWEWFSSLRHETIASGRIFRAYVYSSHERSNMRRISLPLGLLDRVEEFAGSDGYVDLLRVFRDQLVTGNPVGLKKTARWATSSGRWTSRAATPP